MSRRSASRLNLSPFLILAIAVFSMEGCNGDSGSQPAASTAVLNISPTDDNCTPVNHGFSSCAQVCEINPLGCANDILQHVESPGFRSTDSIPSATALPRFRSESSTPFSEGFLPPQAPRFNTT
jgi:hypothetical protein